MLIEYERQSHRLTRKTGPGRMPISGNGENAIGKPSRVQVKVDATLSDFGTIAGPIVIGGDFALV